MTSLERAVAMTNKTSTDTASSPATSFETRNGSFESCFSKGLDLSEFSTRNTTTTEKEEATNHNNSTQSSSLLPKRTSAAAELLGIKQQEKLQREQDQKEELQFQQAIQKQVATTLQKLTKHASSSTSSSSSMNFMDALVQMHGMDTQNPMYRQRQQKQSQKQQSNKKISSPSVVLHNDSSKRGRNTAIKSTGRCRNQQHSSATTKGKVYKKYQQRKY